MPKTGQIELWKWKSSPEFEHRPQAGIIKQKEGIVAKAQLPEVFDEFELGKMILRAVDKQEVGGLQK